MGSQTVGRDLATEQEQTGEHRVKLWSGRGRPGSVSSTETPSAASCGCCGPDAGLAGAAGAVSPALESGGGECVPGILHARPWIRGWSGENIRAGETQAV